MDIRRKVFVINTTADTGANMVDSAHMNLISIVESGKLLFAFNRAGKTVTAIDSVAEAVQVLNLTIGTLVAGQKYTLKRVAPVLALASRDANFPVNTKSYSWTAPAIISNQATERAALIAAILAKVNADSSNYATADSSDGGVANLRITENAGYGLLPTYPGPASWMMTAAGTEITHVLTTPGKIAIGNGTVMLANRAQWTLDGRWMKSGEEVYNFDSTLPTSGKTYCTFIIKEKYGMADHGNVQADISDEILLYVDETTADHIADLKTALGV